ALEQCLYLLKVVPDFHLLHHFLASLFHPVKVLEHVVIYLIDGFFVLPGQYLFN
ncbi:MAG: hypothetical protein GYA71_02415, partial [Bacteroidales bacterium]|nr:hypothetical protein [Bacteroidales bacterium]